MLEAYSGHADGPGLTRWAQARRPVSGVTYLVHGEQANISALRARLIESGFEDAGVIAAKLDETYTLNRTAARRGEAIPRIEAESVSRLDWHNARAEFLSRLSAAAEAAPDNAARKELFERLATALDADASGGAVSVTG
jgi:metallo-beta-lactamase family protein